MKKKLFFAAIALTTLAGCTDESYVGDQSLLDVKEDGAITFGTGLKAMTRAEKSGSDAATLLNNNFVFMGTKGTTPVEVFPNYQANYVSNTANTTVTNTNNWEYVNYKNLPGGVKSNDGVTAFSTTTTGDPNNSTAVDQSIKYWDYGVNQYDFAAYSLGTGYDHDNDASTSNKFATSTAINKSTKSYTITGSADALKACYISDLVTKYNRDDVSDYGAPVQFKFRSMAAKIRLAFYETVPGYSVKNVQFYTDATSALATDGTQNDPTLFASSSVLPKGAGSISVTFPTTGWSNKSDKDYNKAHVAFTKNSDIDLSSTLVLEDLASFADKEYREDAGSYLGRTSSTATFAGGTEGTPAVGKYFSILPYEAGANLTLRIKYTLVSRDGSKEEITVDNASAVIPAELAKWSPNYAYTYIFKIGDMTNGSTGVDGSNNVITGLTPITLDAVVVDDEDGVQETITTVSTPSITTYSAGKVITANDEYKKDKTIYIIVNNGTSNVALTVDTDALLYTATLTKSTDDGDTPAATPAQSITEETVANALAHGTKDDPTSPTTWTVKDANKWKLVVTKSGLLNTSTKIDAADSPTGNDITVNGAKFTPTASGFYAFEYIKEAVNYTAEEANTHNAGLDGAKAEGDILTQAEADAYNAKLTGALTAGATLTGDVLTTVNGLSGVSKTYNDNDEIVAADAALYNASLPGALSTTALTAEQAAAYNSKLTGAVSTSTVKTASSNHYKVIEVVD